MSIYTGYTQKRRRVKLLSAGNDKFLLCPPGTINLSALVNDGTNLRNHVLLWEQISGPPVTLSSTDTLDTSFPHSETNDKVFRFYLDKGTNKEQFSDLDLFYTPTSKLSLAAATAKNTAAVVTVPDLEQTDSFAFPVLDGTVNDNVEPIPATWFTFSKVLSIPESQWISFEVLGELGVFTHNPTTVYQYYKPGDFPTSLILEPGSFKVRVTYKMSGNTVVFISPILVSAPVAVIGPTRIIHDVYASGSVSGHISNFERTSISRLSVSYSIYRTSRSAVSGLPTNLYRYTMDKVDGNNYPDLNSTILYTSKMAVYGSVSELIRLNPSNIGNG